MRSRIRDRRSCAAFGCVQYVEPNAFMCQVHLALLPAANKDELRSAFNAWKQHSSPRQQYLAARIRSILAMAVLEHKTTPAALASVLEKLDTGEWNYA